MTLPGQAAPVVISSQVASRQDTRPPDELREHRPAGDDAAEFLVTTEALPGAPAVSPAASAPKNPQ